MTTLSPEHLLAAKEHAKEIIQLIAEAEARGFHRGWEACKARYDKERAELGQRLDAARTSEELMEAARASGGDGPDYRGSV